MANSPRSEIFDADEIGVYHCHSRCVRRAYLFGVDQYSNNDFGHRQEWIQVRLQQLASVFMIDVLAFAFLDNHFHTMLRNRPDLALKLTDREVAKRSLMVSACSMPDDAQLAEPNEVLIEEALKDKQRIANWRERLSSLSWFMRYLKEPIARRANKEDGVTGHFWEGRFRSVRLLDEYAVLMCCIYVDLNEIRAKKATKPEESKNCSIGYRIETWEKAQQRRIAYHEPDSRSATNTIEPAPSWLAPISDTSANGTRSNTMTEEQPKTPGARSSNLGFLPLSVVQYIQIVDWAGRSVKAGKRGAIPQSLAPILDRLVKNKDAFINAASNFGHLFKKFCGAPSLLIDRASKRNVKRVSGLRVARLHY